QVPLGRPFVVAVTPRPEVRIEEGTLHYAIDDGVSPWVSLPLTPLVTDFIATVPADAVTEHGIKYYVTVENIPFTAAAPATAPAEPLLRQAVARPTAITAVPRPTSGAEFLAGRAVDVE